VEKVGGQRGSLLHPYLYGMQWGRGIEGGREIPVDIPFPKALLDAMCYILSVFLPKCPIRSM